MRVAAESPSIMPLKSEALSALSITVNVLPLTETVAYTTVGLETSLTITAFVSVESVRATSLVPLITASI